MALVVIGPADWPVDEISQVVTCEGVVSGEVYHDLNRNGVRDADEVGVVAVVDFRPISGSGGLTTFSQGNGVYSATLVCDDYMVVAYNSDLWLSSRPEEVVITAGERFLPVAVNYPTSFTASGIVFIDGDGDGKFRSGGRDKTVSSAVVVLTSNAITGTKTTTATIDGLYEFRGLPSGTYQIVAETPLLKGKVTFPLGVALSGRADIAVSNKSRLYLPLVVK